MKYPVVLIEENTISKLFVFALPDDIELEALPHIPYEPDYLPTQLLYEAWYTSLQQGLDWRTGYTSYNPSYTAEPKGGTGTYYFTVGAHRFNFADFDKARRQLNRTQQQHLLSIAERSAQPRMEVLFWLWNNFLSLTTQKER